MWRITKVFSDFRLWFSDGKPIDSIRGQANVSSRLIVDQKGFLDLTELSLHHTLFINANSSILVVEKKKVSSNTLYIELSVRIHKDGSFELVAASTCPTDLYESVSGKLKPLPEVSKKDAEYMSEMIKRKYVPYQKIPDAPGKTEEQIRTLGLQLFPFSPFSFQLAMSVYDWTTASFTRMVFLKIFEYTGISASPFPIDQKSIAKEIWASNWPPYTPQDEYFMNSFMMKPASTLEDVETQLSNVSDELHEFSNVQNRLLSAAILALPRTSILSRPRLFSGQVDIYQLGLDHFGIEFLECPLNNGPAGTELIFAFADAMSNYISTGKIITTKMVWSFTDNLKDAMHYSNGIILMANCPGDTLVWESAAYVTDISDDPKKTEYVFAPETRFEVKSVNQAKVDDRSIVVIELEPKAAEKQSITDHNIIQEARGLTNLPRMGEVAQEVQEWKTAEGHPPHTEHQFGGRRCACLDVPNK
ncbi:hypothetical protein F5Y11DRAFT_309491 [Daldinia sp. FL1419]|nr:hypothetical protein F5Y11DRAFT_309491 [Daldinia sp. FL1419]